MAIFNIIEEIRMKLFMDVTEFSKKLGITRSAYYYYRNGSRTPAFYVRKRVYELAKDNNIYYPTEKFYE